MNGMTKIAVMTAMAACLVAMTGCGTMRYVESQPSGAKILLDGEDTGLTTPGKLRVGSLEKGLHTIAVQMDGFRTTTPPQDLVVQVSTDKIIGTVVFLLVPALFEPFGDMWKESHPRKLRTFYMEKQVGPTREAAATATKAPASAP